jgi:hypothetical protein
MNDLESNERLGGMSEMSKISEDESLLQDEEVWRRRLAEEEACKRCAAGSCRERWIIFTSSGIILFLLSVILVGAALMNTAISRDARRCLPDSVYCE